MSLSISSLFIVSMMYPSQHMLLTSVFAQLYGSKKSQCVETKITHYYVCVCQL